MGNKITFHPRVLLTQEIALRFLSADLDEDVLKTIGKWRAEGAGLGIGLQEFQDIFGTTQEPESQFALFDTDRDGKIDAHEVIMAAILLSTADVQRKIETVCAIFDFSGGRGGSGEGSINFEEAMTILEACSRGLLKICEFDFEIPQNELHFYCKSLFDMHRVDPAVPLSLRQFKEWALADPSPRTFVYLFHFAQGLRDISEEVKNASDEQNRALKAAAGGHRHASAEALKGSDLFRDAIQAHNDEEVDTIVDLMLSGRAASKSSSNDREPVISSSRFHAVLRPWNIFNELDLDGTGTLDEKDIESLMWALSGQRPPAEDVNAFSKLAGAYSDGCIDRSTWLEAVISQQDGRPPSFKTKHLYEGARRSRASVTSIAVLPDVARSSRMRASCRASHNGDGRHTLEVR